MHQNSNTVEASDGGGDDKIMWAAMTRSIEILVAFIEYYSASTVDTIAEQAR